MINEDIIKLKKTIKFINELNFTDDEIKKYYHKIIKINDDLNKCANSSSEKCIHEDEMHEVFVRDDNSRLFTTLIKCSKFINKPNSHLDNYLLKDFNFQWDNLFFKKKYVRVDNMARKVLVKELWNQLRNNNLENLYIYSNHSLGKTYLLSLFCNSLATLKKKICFLDLSKLILDFKYSNSSLENFKIMINKINISDVLVIDNLGLEKFNNYIIIENLLPIIITRKNRGLPTYFISYLSLEKLELKYINDVKPNNNNNYNMNTKINLDSSKHLIKKFINTIRSSLDKPEISLDEK